MWWRSSQSKEKPEFWPAAVLHIPLLTKAAVTLSEKIWLLQRDVWLVCYICCVCQRGAACWVLEVTENWHFHCPGYKGTSTWKGNFKHIYKYMYCIGFDNIISQYNYIHSLIFALSNCTVQFNRIPFPQSECVPFPQSENVFVQTFCFWILWRKLNFFCNHSTLKHIKAFQDLPMQSGFL